ncbi:hypothetical protein K435DRAFT_963953 [Dendrothele bispora CBS 962.96]|uniref:Uncharacterized protein n=1 Tax=Dendrothele bispora (strain CBS 962.96) TaxID=1314807 RepID=A0A4S8MDV2_DENBC|nr:hypothetical protein K435DRAFT_963953 [Dendrothele bispora CBS 962.96]
MIGPLSFVGHVETPLDAWFLAWAAHIGMLQRVPRQLSRQEACSLITSGAVFVYYEHEIKRWTDCMLWSCPRADGNFTLYHQCTRREVNLNNLSQYAHGKLKPHGLLKQKITIALMDNIPNICVVSYFSARDVLDGKLEKPSSGMGPEFFPLIYGERLRMACNTTDSVSRYGSLLPPTRPRGPSPDLQLQSQYQNAMPITEKQESEHHTV